MKVRFICDSGANIHSANKSKWLDTIKDLGFEENEWETMTESDKMDFVYDWADEMLEIYYEEK